MPETWTYEYIKTDFKEIAGNHLPRAQTNPRDCDLSYDTEEVINKRKQHILEGTDEDDISQEDLTTDFNNFVNYAGFEDDDEAVQTLYDQVEKGTL